MSKPEYDLCVIGAGSAGLVAAAGATAIGAKVVLVEKHKMGGDCLNYGCVPSKALLHSAKVAQTLRSAAAAGIDAHLPEIDLARVMQRVRSVIQTIESHDSPERFRSLGVEVIFGAGKFTGPQGFEVNGRTFSARKYIIATGSRPAVPDIPGLNSVPYLTNETVFDLAESIPRLIVLGGGPIGVELAQAFTRLGSQVFLVDFQQRILKNEDQELAAVVEARLRHEGTTLHLGATPLRFEGEAGRIRLLIKTTDGVEQWLESSHLLVAAGRRANIENLGLAAAGVQVNNGRIVTDKRLRTANSDIYACGDVVWGHISSPIWQSIMPALRCAARYSTCPPGSRSASSLGAPFLTRSWRVLVCPKQRLKYKVSAIRLTLSHSMKLIALLSTARLRD